MINSELPDKVGKPPTEHPYQKCIKRIFADKLKYSHNSIYSNPVLPVKIPKRRYTGERIKFTVIGIRSIPEFNYCVQIVQGLHRYRTYLFDPPDIQAVTCVDWPKVWTDLKVRYGGITHCIRSSVVILVNGNILGGTPEFEEYLKTRFNYYLCLDYYNLAVQSFIKFVRSSGKPHVFMHIAIDDEEIGTFIFRLYSDLVPSTCENFLRLCNTTRGGYGGTPIHRIVKDNWIQCGGYGLKNNPNLDCENFIVPHDRRGVLAMANDGRNCDCSTQFFILLQPSPWMARKYVAFGQLIDGEQTLGKIEKVPTFYESPLSKIVIAKAGILNLEATDIVISPGTTEFIQGHIEDLATLGSVALGWIMQKVDLEIEIIEVAKLEALGEDHEEYLDNEGAMAAVRNTARFMRKKDSSKGESEVAEQPPYEGAVNEDFDVEEYEYVYEEEVIYKQVTPPGSIDARPPRPYFIPLTDVVYPGEKDSTYDLRKFLKGDYCLESDLQPNTSPRKKAIRFHPGLHPEEESQLKFKDQSPEISVHSLDSDDRSEIRRYLRNYSDHVSFAGGIVTKIAKGTSEYINIFEEPRLPEEQKALKARKVSLVVPDEECLQHSIKRRQTGYVQLSSSEMEHATASDMVKLALGLARDSSDTQERHVRIADVDQRQSTSDIGSFMTPKQRNSGVENHGVVRGDKPMTDDRDDSERQMSVMKRLYDDVTRSDDEIAPTLRNYRPSFGLREKGMLLTNSIQQLHHEESSKGKFKRPSYTHDQISMEQMLTLQHGKKFARKISSDYVRTIDQFEQPVLNSLRSLEYAKIRPSMSVAEYQRRNEMYQEKLRLEDKERATRQPSPVPSVKLETKFEPPEDFAAATPLLIEEEKDRYKMGEEEKDEANFISMYKKDAKRTEEVTTTTYEKITTSVEVKMEENKTFESFMDPQPVFNTRSTTPTNVNDGGEDIVNEEIDHLSSNTSGSRN